jgi:metallo-beta-lactamase class B
MVAALASLAVSSTASRDVVELRPDLAVEQLAPGVWRHTSYKNLPTYGNTPANGMIVVSDSAAMVVDTPWTNEQMEVLGAWLADSLHARVIVAVPCHAHDDCIGGLGAAHRMGATSYALNQTLEFAKRDGKEIPQNAFADSMSLTIGAREILLLHAGPGHTPDNIVAWVPDQKVLFGGCLVRSAHAKSLGNTAEADLQGWPGTIRTLLARFPDAGIIIPGHGAPGGLDLLDHTLALLAERE